MTSRSFARTRSHRWPLARAAAVVFAAVALAASSTAPAQEAESAAAEDESFRGTWRERTDRPVIAFLRGPAGMLLTPDEVLEYERMVDHVARLKFIERFWFDVATNCPPGENPVRDEFWERAEIADERFGDGVPGWLSDRGRTFLLLGEPATEDAVQATLDGAPREALVWRYESAVGPKSVVFFQDFFGYRLVGHDLLAEDGSLTLSAEDVANLDAETAVFAGAFRTKGCELTPEQLAQQAQVAWRRTLWNRAGDVLEGGGADVPSPLEPIWHFFPAKDGATFTMLTIPLDQPLSEGERLVAMLRGTEGGDVAFVFGTDDFPFDLRASAAGSIAQSARALPPGRYAAAAGVVDADNALDLRYVGQPIVARVTGEDLRLTSVVVASEMRPSAEAAEPGAFRIGGFEVVPRIGSALRAGEDLNILFQVVGASSGEGSPADLTVSYQLHGKPPGRDWVKIGAPNVSTEPGAVRVWSLPITAAFRPADYKIEIEVVDDASGARVSKEIPFRVVGS